MGIKISETENKVQRISIHPLFITITMNIVVWLQMNTIFTLHIAPNHKVIISNCTEMHTKCNQHILYMLQFEWLDSNCPFKILLIV